MKVLALFDIYLCFFGTFMLAIQFFCSCHWNNLTIKKVGQKP